MNGGDSQGAKAGRNGMEANNFSIYGMKVGRIGENRALLSGVQITKREKPFLRREVPLHRRIDVAGMRESNNTGLTMGIRERSIGDGKVAIDALAPMFGAVKFDYHGMLLVALKCSLLMTIGLRRRRTTQAILECMFAINARKSFLGIHALYRSMASS